MTLYAGICLVGKRKIEMTVLNVILVLVNISIFVRFYIILDDQNGAEHIYQTICVDLRNCITSVI